MDSFTCTYNDNFFNILFPFSTQTADYDNHYDITCFTLTKLIHLMINCNSIYVFVFCVLLLLHGIGVELH